MESHWDVLKQTRFSRPLAYRTYKKALSTAETQTSQAAKKGRDQLSEHTLSNLVNSLHIRQCASYFQPS